MSGRTPNSLRDSRSQVTVIALVGGEGSQIARVSAGDLLAHVCVTPSFGCRTMNVENRSAVCIDECRRFERLNPVIRPLAVVATRA